MGGGRERAGERESIYMYSLGINCGTLYDDTAHTCIMSMCAYNSTLYWYQIDEILAVITFSYMWLH